MTNPQVPYGGTCPVCDEMYYTYTRPFEYWDMHIMESVESSPHCRLNEETFWHTKKVSVESLHGWVIVNNNEGREDQDNEFETICQTDVSGLYEGEL